MKFLRSRVSIVVESRRRLQVVCSERVLILSDGTVWSPPRGGDSRRTSGSITVRANICSERSYRWLCYCGRVIYGVELRGDWDRPSI